MFKSEVLLPDYRTLLGWHKHFDISEITIDPSLEVSDSKEYYQEKHPAMRLDYIAAMLPANRTLNEYLKTTVDSSINAMFNDLLQYRQIEGYGKTLLEQAQLLNKQSWLSDKITNMSRFVGLQIKVKNQSGLMTVLEEIGLQIDNDQELEIHLFHSEVKEKLTSFTIESKAGFWSWKKVAKELPAISPELYHGGVFILGYYQDDLAGSAINYTNFNWDIGECQGCTNSYYDIWKSINNYYHVYPLYVPEGSYTVGEMFDLQKAFHVSNQSFGLNLKLSVKCDFTDFFIQNKMQFKNLLAYKVVMTVLNDMKFSTETNHVEENLKMMIIRDIEGDKETNLVNSEQKYQREIKAVAFNTGGINNKCLGCFEQTYKPKIGMV